MNVFVMSLYALLLLGNAPSYASEASASFEHKATAEKEMQRWLKEHDLQQHFTTANVITSPFATIDSNRCKNEVPHIFMRVPEEVWQERWQALLQSKPSLRTYIIAGVTMGASAGGAVGGAIAYADPNQFNKSRAQQALLGMVWMVAGGTVGVILGKDLYKEQYSNYKAACSEITRATSLEKVHGIRRGYVLLSLNGLRDLLSHHRNRIPDIESVIMNARKKD